MTFLKARHNLIMMGKSIYMLFTEKILMRLPTNTHVKKLPFSVNSFHLCASLFLYGKTKRCQVQIYLHSLLKCVPRAPCDL